MLNSFGVFETQVNLVNLALQSNKSKVKKLNELKQKLETAYFKLDEDYRVYKTDCIEKDCQTLDAFNGVAADNPSVPNFEMNDAWSKKQMLFYMSTTVNIEEKVESLE